MPSNLPAKCRYCGRKRSDGFAISRRGKCDLCAMARMQASIVAQGIAVEHATAAAAAWAKQQEEAATLRGVGGTPARSTNAR